MRRKNKIFIPFLEGTLTHNCQECGYDCCATGSLIMNAGEQRKLLREYPSLRYFFFRKIGEKYTVRKSGRCWFLKNNGLCHIQEKYGYSSKPFICRIHPFYVSKCGDEYIVDPQLCAGLQVKQGRSSISHEQILERAQEAVDLDFTLREIDWSGKRLKLEKGILEGSKHFLANSNYLEFAAYQIAVATGKRGSERIKRELANRLDLWKSFLSVEGLEIDAKELNRELTAITSLLRLRSAELTCMEESMIPEVLLALYLYMILFLKTRKVRMYVTTYQVILEEFAIGLARLGKKDLSFKKKSMEERVHYLHILRRIPKGLRDSKRSLQKLRRGED